MGRTPTVYIFAAAAVASQSGFRKRCLEMSEQIPFEIGTNDFASNPEQRTACVLLLDVSGSMSGQPIAELNAGLQAYKDSLVADALAAKRVEVAIVTFGGQVQTVCDFTTVESFQPPHLVAGGDTPMGAAIQQGIEMLTRRKADYKTAGVPYTRPWLFLITDGGPTDAWHGACDTGPTGRAGEELPLLRRGSGRSKVRRTSPDQ